MEWLTKVIDFEKHRAENLSTCCAIIVDLFFFLKPSDDIIANAVAIPHKHILLTKRLQSFCAVSWETV